jgi:alpha-tubulin suppressor-like RCC1 family protein
VLRFRVVVAGPFHSMALTVDGELYTWGMNKHRQLGLGDYTNRIVPTLIPPVPTKCGEFKALCFKSITTSYFQSIAITTEGQIYGWGAAKVLRCKLSNHDIKSSKYISIPTLLAISEDFRDIKTEKYNSLAINNEGLLYSLTKSKIKRIPSQIKFKAIAVGQCHSLTLTVNDKLYVLGSNGFGQLGTGNSKTKYEPKLVCGELNFKAIAAGSYHSLALTTQGKLYAWGYNGYGQLGLSNDDGRKIDRSYVSVLIFPELCFKDIFAGSDHSMALTVSNKLYTLGYYRIKGAHIKSTHLKGTNFSFISLDNLDTENLLENLLENSSECSYITLLSTETVYSGYNLIDKTKCCCSSWKCTHFRDYSPKTSRTPYDNEQKVKYYFGNSKCDLCDWTM